MREHLYRALTTEHGIVLSTDEPDALVQKLHKAKREAQDHQLLQLTISKRPDGKVWIIKKPKTESVSDGPEA